MNELQSKEPEIFGQYGGSNRVFSLQEIAISLGLMVGPLISGYLSQAVGYYWMSFTFGEYCSHTSLSLLTFQHIAMLCLASSIASICYLSPKTFTESESDSTSL